MNWEKGNKVADYLPLSGTEKENILEGLKSNKRVLIPCSKMDCPILIKDLMDEDEIHIWRVASFNTELNRETTTAVSRSAEEYLDWLFSMIRRNMEKDIVNKARETANRELEELTLDRMTLTAVRLRLDGMSYTRIVEELVRLGYPLRSWQTIHNRVRNFRLKYLF